VGWGEKGGGEAQQNFSYLMGVGEALIEML